MSYEPLLSSSLESIKLDEVDPIVKGKCSYTKNEIIIDIPRPSSIHLTIPISSTLYDLLRAFQKVGHDVNGFIMHTPTIYSCWNFNRRVYTCDPLLSFGLDGKYVVHLEIPPYKYGIMDLFRSLDPSTDDRFYNLPFQTFQQLIQFTDDLDEYPLERKIELQRQTCRMWQAFIFLHYWNISLRKYGMKSDDLKLISDIAVREVNIIEDTMSSEIWDRYVNLLKTGAKMLNSN